MIINSSDKLYKPPFARRLESLKEELDSLRPLSPEAEGRIMQKFRLDWNYHSNHLEGTQLTYGETKALILFGITAQGKPLKDHLEITGHNEAIELVIEVVKDEYPLTESFIRQLHTLLLKEPYYVNAITPDGQPSRRLVDVGKYKTHPNHVLTQTGEIFYFATPEETPAKMTDLIDWYRKRKEIKNQHPVILAAEFHYKFIRIHPFDDGNGRLARILMNFILMQFGYPPVIIKTEDKNNYFSVLRLADADNLTPFIEYIAKNLERSLEIMLKGAKGESVEEPDDLDKELALLKQRVKNVGTTVEVTKNKESLLDIFEKSVEALVYRFIDICQKFDGFYLKSDFRLFWESTSRDVSIDKALNKAKSSIAEKGNADSGWIEYKYTNFRQTGFGDFNFTSQINFKFELASYTVSLIKTTTNESFKDYRRLYSEQLMPEEIEEMVRLIAQQHKMYIQRQVDEKIEREDGIKAIQSMFDNSEES